MIVTEADVRDYVRDRSAVDHDAFPDIVFTSQDIAQAMRTCARRFNSIHPQVCIVQPDRLPGDTNMFLDGVAWALLENWLTNLSMNDVEYSAGNVSVKVNGTLINNIGAIIKNFSARFEEEAKLTKTRINLSHAYGPIG